MSAIPHTTTTSRWQLLQGGELPAASFCGHITRERPGLYDHIWHAWDAVGGYCTYHHRGGLKAPVARVVANRRASERPL